MRNRLLFIAPASALLLASGCTVGPDYRSPKVRMPESYDAPDTFTANTGGVSPTENVATALPIELATWWKSLNDPELDSLVARAMDANLDLRIALARLEEARAEIGVVVGGSLPSAEFSGGVGRGSGTNSTKGRVSGPLNAGSNTTGEHEITHVVGFDAIWEVDLFGRLRREAEAAMADTQAATDMRNEVLVTIVADVARAYVHVRSLQHRLDIAHQMVAVAQRTVDLTRTKLQRGMVNELDPVLAERQLAAVQSRIQPLEAERSAAARSIAVLLGQFPAELKAELEKNAPLPTPPAAITIGLPGDLLRRRPDIRGAESQLIAANARIGVATAALYPQITLTGGLGYQGQGLGRLPVDWTFIYSAGPSVRWQLLNFGAISSMIDAQDFHTQVLALNYRKTIIGAVQEVENALTNYNAERSRLSDLDRAVGSAKHAADLAEKRYDRGLTDFLNALDAQRQLFDLQDQSAVSEDAAASQFIAVCKSLGGGWDGATLSASAGPPSGNP